MGVQTTARRARCNPVAVDADVRRERRAARAIVDVDVPDQYVGIGIDAGQEETECGQQACSSHDDCPWDRKGGSLQTPGATSHDCRFLGTQDRELELERADIRAPLDHSSIWWCCAVQC
jgi:hypothetical protein